MANGDTMITIVGNVVADPELRFTPAGAPVANFRVVSTPRKYNSQTQQWEDGEAMFLTCNVWRQPAENVAETISKGMRVIVYGKLKARSFQTREGENRTVFEIDVEEVGPSLRYASAQVARNPREGHQQQQQSPQSGQWNQQPTQHQGATWGQPRQPADHPAGRAGQADEPPF